MTKTTSDGVCADCWGGKGGVMGWRHDPPRESFFDDVLDVLGFLLRW